MKGLIFYNKINRSDSISKSTSTLFSVVESMTKSTCYLSDNYEKYKKFIDSLNISNLSVFYICGTLA